MTDNKSRQGKLGRALGEVSGVTPIASQVSKVGRTGGFASRRIGNVFKRALGSHPGPQIPADITEPSDRFMVAMAGYGVDDTGIEVLIAKTRQQAYLYIALSIAFLGWAFYIAQPTLIGVLFPFFPLFALVPFAIRACFWNWQLRTRRLGSFNEFRRSKSEWLPHAKSSSALTMSIGVAVAAMYILVPGYAQAQNIGPAADFLSGIQSVDDLWLQILRLIAPIGPVGQNTVTSPWVGPLSNAFGAFNGALLMIASAMLGWQTLVGMVSTAHEGRMLGQKWHQIWAPVRVTIGVGMLAPLAGGFAAVQMVVLQIALMGGALANTVWSAYIGSYADRTYLTALIKTPGERDSMASALNEIVVDGPAGQLMFGLVGQQVCLRGVRSALEQGLITHETRTGQGGFDLTNATSDQLLGFERTMQQIAPELSKHLSARPVAGKISYAEAATGELRGYVQGADQSRLLRSVQDSGWVSYPNPVVVYGNSLCGTFSIDFFDSESVAERLTLPESASSLAEKFNVAPPRQQQYGNGVYAQRSNAARYRGYSPEQRAEFNDLHVKAYSLMYASSVETIDQLDTYMMPSLANAADVIYASYDDFKDIENPVDKQAALKAAFDPRGPAAQSIAQAYQAYVDIMQQQRTKQDNSIYEMVETADVSEYIRMSQDMGWASAGSFYMLIARVQQMNINIAPPSGRFDSDFTALTSLVSDREEVILPGTKGMRT